MRQRRADDNTTFLDFLFLLLLVIILLVNDPVPPTKALATPPGNLIVTIVWPEGDTDVDMWVWSEGEERPVGFSNRSGKFWSLLRDDLGTRNDTLPANLENAYSREIPKGRTVVNIHCFTCRVVPVPVSVEIAVVNGGRSSVLLRTNLTLISNRQEMTVISFEMADGRMVPNSAHNVFFPMYENWESGQ